MNDQKIQPPNMDRFTTYQEVHAAVASQDISSLTESDGGYVAGDLSMITQIGTPGVYGTVWKTICKDKIIASKIMPAAPKENINEVRINKFVTEIVLRKISRHFLMTHITHEVILNDKKHFLVLNEMAGGDLKELIQTSTFLSNTDQVLNACIQCVISIATLHSYGFVHNDCHYGNFLFTQSVPCTGYYHYNIYGKDYYLQDCGYEMMLYDFGLVTKYDETGLSKNLSIEDFRRALPFFMLSDDAVKLEKDCYGLINPDYKELRGLSKFCQTLHYNLFKDVKTNETKKEPHCVVEYIMNELLNFGGRHIFTDVRPDSIINRDKPFMISSDLPKDIKKLVPRVLKLPGKR
jgi:serine/threonine protein kinase